MSIFKVTSTGQSKPVQLDASTHFVFVCGKCILKAASKARVPEFLRYANVTDITFRTAYEIVRPRQTQHATRYGEQR
jgi:hypothetical protein